MVCEPDAKTTEYELDISAGVKIKFILLNFPNGDGSWDQALSWAEKNGCAPTHIQEAMLVGAEGDLAQVLDIHPLDIRCLIATTKLCDSREHVLAWRQPDGNEILPVSIGLSGAQSDSTWFLFHQS